MKRQEAEKAAAINPTDPSATYYIGASLLWQGKYEQALHVWRNVPQDYNPSVVGAHSAWALFQLGRKDEAAAKIEDLLKRYPEDPGGQLTGVQAVLLAASGEAAKAENKIKHAMEKKAFAHFHHTAYSIACAYAQMNQPGPAIQWLQQSTETGFPCYPFFERDPNLDHPHGSAFHCIDGQAEGAVGALQGHPVTRCSDDTQVVMSDG